MFLCENYIKYNYRRIHIKCVKCKKILHLINVLPQLKWASFSLKYLTLEFIELLMYLYIASEIFKNAIMICHKDIFIIKLCNTWLMLFNRLFMSST